MPSADDGGMVFVFVRLLGEDLGTSRHAGGLSHEDYLHRHEVAKCDLAVAEATLRDLCQGHAELADLPIRWRHFNVPDENGKVAYCGAMACYKPLLPWEALAKGDRVRAAALECHDKRQVLKNSSNAMPWLLRQQLKSQGEQELD
jgi:hypothetical protein